MTDSHPRTRIILVDDHAIVRAGFRMLLAEFPGIEVIAEADRGEAVYQLYLDHQPDMVVMDLSMPGVGGLETIRRLISRISDAKILVFSVHNEKVYVSRAIDAGAKGYISKNSAPEILVDAILAIASGIVFIEPGLGQIVAAQPRTETDYQQLVESLSPKEFDVFCLLVRGLTAQRIADELCLGYKTVANYSTQIKAKFNVATVTELARIAAVLGIIQG